MIRSLGTVGLTLGIALAAHGQCWGPPIVAPSYYGPEIWGGPLPRPFPPAPRFIKRAAVKEDTERLPAPRVKDTGTTPKAPEKPKDSDRFPKIKLPSAGELEDKDPSKVKAAVEKKQAVDQFVIPADTNRAEPRADVKVGFFNHSDHDVVLEVQGDEVKLPSGQYVTLRLPRTFKWSEKGKKGTETVVPADAEGLEIVFRK